MFIYSLSLKNGRYYIGRTENWRQRLEQHKIGVGSAWTQMHPFIEVEEVVEGDKYDEDSMVIRYMDKYGIENVRGGVYSNPVLTFEQYLQIRKQLNHVNDCCLACGKKGHFVTNCVEKICYRCGRTGHLAEECSCEYHINNGKMDGCYRCGRPDHWKFRCNRSKDIYGREIKAPAGLVQMLSFFL